MGYSHQYYTRKEIDPQAFKNIVTDFKKLIPVMEHLGVKLGDGFGENQPIITDTEIIFNGLTNCGHTKRDIGLTWPSNEAQGVAKLDQQHRQGNETMMNVKGSWFAGLQVETRTCDGDCSYETFSLEQKMKYIPEWKTEEARQNKRIFQSTKTSFRPYDLAVTACLVIAKHYLKNEILIHSDGDLKDWNDAISLTDHFLGYGHDFDLDGDIEEIEKKEAETRQETIKTRIEDMEKREEAKKKLRAKPVELGDIFERSWGYDQTNVDFYKVIEITKTGKSAKVIKIGQKIFKENEFMSETVIPDPDKVTGEKVHTWRIKQYRNDGSIYIGDLWRWDGTPSYQSHYA